MLCLRTLHITLSRLCEVYFAKHVIQASTASSHRVGKCIFEPSKQSRIRKSSFWSHRRSTVQWETALSSKERSRRVNCPMLVPYNSNCIYMRYQQFTTLLQVFNDQYIITLSFYSVIITHISLFTLYFQHIIILIYYYLLRQWQAVTVEYKNDECLALPLFRELGKLPTLCVLNWNAVSLSNSEPLDGVSKISLFKYLNFKWRASLVPAAAVIPAPLAYTIIVAVKRLVVGLNCKYEWISHSVWSFTQ